MKKLHRVQLFGRLESEIMEILWDCPDADASVREVVQHIRQRRPIAYTTVMTVMDRLYKKGVLKRRAFEHAYRYRTADDRETFARHAASGVAKSFIHQFGDIGIAQFVDALEEIDPAKLDALQQELEKHSA